MRPLDHTRIHQSRQNLVRDGLAACKIDHLDWATVNRIAEEKQVKVWVVGIRVNTRLDEPNRAESFDINGEHVHDETPFT